MFGQELEYHIEYFLCGLVGLYNKLRYCVPYKNDSPTVLTYPVIATYFMADFKFGLYFEYRLKYLGGTW